MDRERLKRYLEQSLSLEQIGKLVDRDPSTVGYWVKKHGLVAANQAKHAARGGIPRARWGHWSFITSIPARRSSV